MLCQACSHRWLIFMSSVSMLSWVDWPDYLGAFSFFIFKTWVASMVCVTSLFISTLKLCSISCAAFNKIWAPNIALYGISDRNYSIKKHCHTYPCPPIFNEWCGMLFFLSFAIIFSSHHSNRSYRICKKNLVSSVWSIFTELVIHWECFLQF